MGAFNDWWNYRNKGNDNPFDTISQMDKRVCELAYQAGMDRAAKIGEERAPENSSEYDQGFNDGYDEHIIDIRKEIKS